ncbi:MULTISPECIES: hypothetical protein [unclassified Arthrobacter]|uniref:hypothetical protein n=1 Tax=unclassified Arthrobacter TaxID=235627 RepID=UPI001DEF7E67|nr:hypothetical protein [Arthrobacter sp. Bi26]CAH0127480.1 hypothetical protein SRABI26_00128 [Arthrobacter sp. Bi26]
MTLAPVAPTQTHDLQVRTDPAGKPLAIRHDGRIWVVDPGTESQHWFESDSRQDTGRTAAVGSGGLVSVEYWRVQVRLGSNSPLRTVTLRREQPSPGWFLEHVSDGS